VKNNWAKIGQNIICAQQLYKETIKTLNENRVLLNNIANKLIEDETLYYDDLKVIIAEKIAV